MENEKSVYDMLIYQLKEKDKIINNLIKGIIAITLVAIISVALGISVPFFAHIHGYFWSSYTDKTDNSITGDNSTNVSSNTLKDKSEIDIDN